MKAKLILLSLILLLLNANLLYSEPVIAVIDFKNIGNNSSYNYLEKAIPEMLITDILLVEKIKIVERSFLNKILTEQSLVLKGLVEEKDAAKVGKLIGATHIIGGTIFNEKDTLRFDARVIEVSTSRIILTVKVPTTEDNIIKGIDELANKIINKITGKNVDYIISEKKDTPDFIFPSDSKDIISMNNFLNNDYYFPGANKKEIYLYVNLLAGEVKQKKERIPLNIAIVIDRSGSMSSENKLEFAKKAANFVIDNLNVKDYLAIIAYDDKVETINNSSSVRNKLFLKKKVDKLQPGGSTNLSGGMMEGFAQVKVNFKKGFVNRVLLLSDGMANRGITDPEKLQNIVREKNQESISISTFGIGSYFNEDLMVNLSEYGGANYYFIDTSDKIPEIFARELKGLLSVVAQNVKVKIKFPHQYLTLKKVFAYHYKKENNEISINFNDVFSKEEKAVLLKFEIKKPFKNKINFETLITYDDVVLKNKRITKNQISTLTKTDNKKLYSKNFNTVVLNNIALFESNDLMEKAIKEVDNRNYEEAKKYLSKNKEYIYNQFKDYKQPVYKLKEQYLNVLKYEEDIKNFENLPEEEAEYIQKSNKAVQYELKKKK